MTIITFTATIRVNDPQALHAAALRQCMDIDGLGKDEAIEIIGTSTNPDVEACIQACLDPGSLAGCSIFGSTAEAT